MQIVTSPPKKTMFKFLFFAFFFISRRSSWALVSIPVAASFQTIAWVAMTSLYCPSSENNDPKYVCGYCRKICTTKDLIKLHLKATQHNSYAVVGKDQPATKNVDVVEDALVIPNEPCLIPCMKVFLMNTFEKTYEWKDLL